jgi:excinuclease ABC subunit C
MDREKLRRLHRRSRSLTAEPGVYLMRAKNGELLYIGKAKSLRNRVSSYFRAVERHTPKVAAMVGQIEDFETIVTASEFEALVLECSLIKLHAPKYNILLKDDKGYSYLRVDAGDYPRITEVKQMSDDGAQYIGPYMSAWVVRQTADEANKAFGLPTCSRVFPRDLKKGRPCLNFHLKQCMGVCRGDIPPEEYRESVRQAVEYIRGGSAETARLLGRQMQAAADSLDYERAARCRDRLRAIERFSERQRVVYAGVADQDVLAFVQAGQDVGLSLLKFRGQKLVDKLDFFFADADAPEEVREEFLSRYYGDLQHELPAQITLDGDLPDRALIERFLSERAGKKIALATPQRGALLRLVEMARQNAAEQLSLRGERRTGRELAALDELAKLLGLPKPPGWIESYDVSNIGSDVFVGAMAVFEDARPLKSAWRRFKLQGVERPDDYACMAQMLHRRFARYLAQQPDGGSFNRLPDLILVDGGKGHVTAARRVLDALDLSIPVFGMVKDDRHRTRAISAEGGEIAIAPHRSVFTLVSNIQNETHRWAVEYARKSHRRTAFELSLTGVAGIGPARARALFRQFKTKKAILAAGEDDLCAVKGMTRPAARALIEAVRRGEIG